MNVYRGLGLTLTIIGGILTYLTYTFIGSTPLTALWIGILIVGVVIMITPEETIGKRELLAVIEDMLSNLAIFFEALGTSSVSTYVDYGGEVYIFISNRIVDNPPKDPPKSMFINLDGGRAIVLRSPISSIISRFLEEGGDIDSITNHILVEVLEIAENVMCVESGENISFNVKKPSISVPARIEKAIGSIYASIIASIASSIYKCPIVIIMDREEDDKRIIVLRRIVSG
ncbi:hypothetical protein [Thermofilum sp.]|uniref:hypothetical protein n=1 Tax=Thermofilum sp. TaxID=1961369 RepID=UPI0031619005